MSIRKRTLAAAAGFAFVATAVITPAALANGDDNYNGHGHRAQPSVPDPTTCTDGLLTLVRVRTDANRLGARVTIAERQDAAALDALRKAQADLANARTVEATTWAKWNTAKTNLANINAEPVPHNPTWASRHADAISAEQLAHQAYVDAHADRVKAEAALIKARQDAERSRSYLAELRVKQTDEGALVARLTLLVDGLCQHPVPVPLPTPEPTTEPAPTEEPAPPVDNTPVIVNQPQTQIINNPSIGQVPTGSNTGGGAEAAIVE